MFDEGMPTRCVVGVRGEKVKGSRTIERRSEGWIRLSSRLESTRGRFRAMIGRRLLRTWNRNASIWVVDLALLHMPNSEFQ